MDEACESCGRTGEHLTVVRRIWVTPEAWDTEGRVEPGDLESWCATCIAHYPHQEVDPADEVAESDDEQQA
jgi:hypothetical protein